MNNENHIGIINLQYTSNYGAVIAAAVLEDVVREITNNNFIVNTIDYFPYKKMPNRFLQIADEAKQYGGWKLYFKARTSSKTTPRDISLKRGQRFSAFKSEFLNLTSQVNDAYKINENINYSAFITGSDVVWATKRTDDFRAEGYYLKFANKGERKIAYAPSIDNKVDKKLKKLSHCYKNAINGLDFISIRELENVSFLQNLTDKKVYNCCDPAFLVNSDYYDKMIEIADVDKNDDKYIYVYVLEINQELVDFANKLAKEKGLKIYYYSANHKNYECESVDCTSDGPAEFLYRLKNAEYVLTNSFHCVVFSLLFKKQFLSFIRSDISIKSTDLLNRFNLNDRVFVNNQNIDKKIDFDLVETNIKTMQQDSLEYLKLALKDL